MFEIGKIYWIVVKSDKYDKITFKGKLLDENQFMLKIEKENNKEIEFIPLQTILSINEVRDKKC